MIKSISNNIKLSWVCSEFAPTHRFLLPSGRNSYRFDYTVTFIELSVSTNATNSAWETACKKAELTDLRLHDTRHTWASWHRQAGTSCDELKDLGGWKSRVMVDRYAKFGTEHLFAAASRIESRGGSLAPTPVAPAGRARTEAKEKEKPSET